MSSENALMRGLAERATADPLIAAAKGAASTLHKAVVQTPEDAASVTSLLGAVRKGRLNAEKALDDILRDPKSAIKEAKEHLDPIIKAFKEVEDSGKAAVARFLVEQRQQAAEAERKEREAALAAATEADLPAMEVEAPATQSIVRSGTGTSTHLVTRTHVEMLDAGAVAAYDSSLLKLIDSEALAAYRHYGGGTEQLKGGKLHPAGGIEWNGMRFFEEHTVAQRG